jgi:multidrug resistance efflux pump
MESELPAKEQLAAQATEGRPITQSEASAIAHAESDMTRRGPIKGGPAATAQSLHDRQQNFFEVAGDVARKPSAEVTKEDAKKVQHFEVSRILTVLHLERLNLTRVDL